VFAFSFFAVAPWLGKHAGSEDGLGCLLAHPLRPHVVTALPSPLTAEHFQQLVQLARAVPWLEGKALPFQ